MMSLSDLIHKNRTKPIATATVATPATHGGENRATVANVASVAVANPCKQKIEPDKAAIVRWLHFIGENSRPIIDDVLAYSASNREALAYYLERAGKVSPPDDRHHCHECLNLRNGYCIQQRFRPVDDLRRRCEDFNDSRN